MYPTPPPPHTVTNCSDGGVIGAGMWSLSDCLKILECIISSLPPLVVHTLAFLSPHELVPGMIGTLQALEVMKLAANIGGNNLVSFCCAVFQLFHHPTSAETYSQKMLVFDGLLGITRTVKLRPRQPTCAVCGDNPTITRLIDYEVFCSSKADDKSVNKLNVLDVKQRVTCQQYKEVVDAGHTHLLVDVREPVEYEICCLSNSISKCVICY